MNYKVFLSVVAFMGASVHGMEQKAPVEQKNTGISGLFGWGNRTPAAATTATTTTNPAPTATQGGNGAVVVSQPSGSAVSTHPNVAPNPTQVSVLKGSRKACIAWILRQQVPVNASYRVYYQALIANSLIAAALSAEATPPIQDDGQIPSECRYASKKFIPIGKANAVSNAVSTAAHSVAKDGSKKQNDVDVREAEAAHKASLQTSPVTAATTPTQNLNVQPIGIPSGPVTNPVNTAGAQAGGPKTPVIAQQPVVTTAPPPAVVSGSTVATKPNTNFPGAGGTSAGGTSQPPSAGTVPPKANIFN